MDGYGLEPEDPVWNREASHDARKAPVGARLVSRGS
jgi:hypothetical protein